MMSRLLRVALLGLILAGVTSGARAGPECKIGKACDDTCIGKDKICHIAPPAPPIALAAAGFKGSTDCASWGQEAQAWARHRSLTPEMVDRLITAREVSEEDAKVLKRMITDMQNDPDLLLTVVGRIATESCGWPTDIQSLSQAKNNAYRQLCAEIPAYSRETEKRPTGAELCP
jgi:hypothetical protein